MAVLVPLALTGMLGTAFAANEWTHGGMSEAMGLGHRHMMDYGAYHCVDHADAMHAAMHLQHMHGNVTMRDAQGNMMFGNATMPHMACAGGAGMHGAMSNGMMSGGMRQ